MKNRDLFLEAIHGRRTPRPGIGSATSIATTDLMDKVRAEFPAAHLDAEKMARLAGAGAEVLGFDNVMPLFSVWHESAALGCPVEWGEKGRMADCRDALCGSIEETFRIPPDFLKEPAAAVPLKALGILRKRFSGEVAVQGKVFGPWTLGYHVYGVQDFLMATLTEPEAVKMAMRNLIEVTVAFANAQLEAGADVVTLADHCTRDLCSPDAYRDFLMEIHAELHARIRGPLVLHICGDTADRIPYIRETGIECFHFDSKVPASRARELAGSKLALMGGTGNLAIVRAGTPEEVVADVRAKVNSGINVIGPECAVPLDASWKNLKLLADEVRKTALAF